MKSSLKKSQQGSPNSLTLPRINSQNEFNERRDDSAFLLSRVDMLEKDLERRTEAYIRRERAYKTRIEELEEEVEKMRSAKNEWMLGLKSNFDILLLV